MAASCTSSDSFPQFQMAEPNDGRISGGPITEAIKKERDSHISKLVFEAQLYDYPPEARTREHGSWRIQRGYHKWELNAEQKELVDAIGSNDDSGHLRRIFRERLVNFSKQHPEELHGK